MLEYVVCQLQPFRLLRLKIQKQSVRLFRGQMVVRGFPFIQSIGFYACSRCDGLDAGTGQFDCGQQQLFQRGEGYVFAHRYHLHREGARAVAEFSFFLL